jgi:hypothetical protein
MPNTIQIKRSSTASATPTAGQLSAGELAINTADGRLFAKNSAGTVVNLPVTSISGQTVTPGKVTAASGAGLGTSADPANFGIAGCKLLTRGDAFIGNAAGTVGVHVGVVAANTWDNTAASVYFESLNEAVTQYKPMILTTGFFPQLALSTDGKIGVNTANPQANFQIITGYDLTGYDQSDPPLPLYDKTTSALIGAAQSEILQVIHGGYEYDANNAEYTVNEYINLARFHVNGPASRGSFSLSNSGTGAWENNVMQFFIHGSSYAPGYYGGNASDAGCAMIVTQGSDIVKLQIGNYNTAPIEFFTGNTKRFRIRQSDGNYDLYSYVENDYTAGPAFVWNNRYDSENNYSGEVAAIQMVTGTAPNEGTLAFYTGQADAIVERVRIDGSGNVGIGVATPTVKLDVDGEINCAGVVVQGRLQSPQTALYLWQNFR